jgi:hypothetical protein
MATDPSHHWNAHTSTQLQFIEKSVYYAPKAGIHRPDFEIPLTTGNVRACDYLARVTSETPSVPFLFWESKTRRHLLYSIDWQQQQQTASASAQTHRLKVVYISCLRPNNSSFPDPPIFPKKEPSANIMGKRSSDEVSKAVVTVVKGGDDDENVAAEDHKDRGMVPAIEAVPPKSLVLIWILMAAELGFDLVTTIIAFAATIGDQFCCGYTIHLGPLPLSTTIPFFLLILAELSFLCRAILFTLWPSVFASDHSDSSTSDEDEGFEVKLSNGSTPAVSVDGKDGNSNDSEREEMQIGSTVKLQVSHEPYHDQVEETESRRKPKKCSLRGLLCCCLRWNAKLTLNALNLLTLLNPFFGCLIAWMLLYQSNKTEAFVVLGLEGFSIILHFISVRLEGGLRTWCSRLIHSVTILPFLISVILMLVYLREGGVCYVVERQLFLFSGCAVCPDTLQPPDANGMCGDVALDGTGGVVQDFENLSWNNLGSLTERGAYQDTYCSESTNYCFFSF